MRLHDPEVLVVGSLHLDIVVRARSMPAIDETARGSSWQMVCGGKGGNQACWASRQGARTAMISRIGRDDFGRRLIDNLTKADVDVSGISVDPQVGSGMSVAILQDDGDYGAVIVSGSNMTMTSEQAAGAIQSLGVPKVLLLQNEIAEQVNIAVAMQARQVGARVVLNAAPAQALAPELASAIDILVVNRFEAGMMCNRSVSSPDEAQEALPSLLALCPAVVITLGSAGVVVGERGRPPVFIPAEKVETVSTHGAGDCFIGQMAAALAHGNALSEACLAANKAAAAYVSGHRALVNT